MHPVRTCKEAKRLTILLADLIDKGLGDEEIADEVREAIDEETRWLSKEEVLLLNNFQGDLYDDPVAAEVTLDNALAALKKDKLPTG